VRPLRHLSSLKLKFGVVVVAAIAVALGGLLAVEATGIERGRAVFAAAVLALIAVQLLAHGTTAPLREMAAAATAMARGEHGHRVRVRGRDEVAHLAEAFNEMSAELEQTDRLRRELVANVAHELRTPLAGLQASLENLLDGVQPPDLPTLAAMSEQVQRLGRMVEQLLDLSRMEAGELALETRRFPAAELLERVRAELAPLAPDSIALVARAPDGLQLEADPERLHQVMINLAENALRFSPPGGRVELAAARTKSGVRLEVADQGPGIAAADRERVFRRFTTTDESRAGGGSGLGLAISRWIVELHGGSIAVAEGGPGCRIVIELPDEPQLGGAPHD